MILLSLSLQIFLIVTGHRRKYTAGIWFGMFVWLAYLSADWLATVTLGILARSQGGSESKGTTSNASFIPAFWAPMLLVHLGGPDTITSYSVEDNEMWSRHLLQLLTQLAVALYASFRSWWSKDPLIYVVIPIFVSGVIKYGERVLVLCLASSDQFRDSVNKERVALQGQIERSFPDENFNSIIPEAKYLHEAHLLFRTLKLVFADYTVPLPVHRISYGILQSKDAAGAFNLIEVEVGFMFDLLFTKVMTTVCPRPRIILRFINFLSPVSALIAFSSMTRKSHTYSKIDIIISYLLLFGAVVLEIYSAILMFFSDWAMLWLSKQRKPPADSFYRGICSSRLLSFFSNNKRWKASMAQNRLTDYPKTSSKHIPKLFSTGNIQNWEVVVDLKELIFKRLLDMRSRCNFPDHKNDILEERGGHALRSKRCDVTLDRYLLRINFHSSLLIWHIAVNNCFDQDSSDSIHRNISRSLSRYMMYLWKDLPLMLPKALGEPLYNQSFRVRYDAEELSKLLELQQEKEGWSVDEKWELISEVLVEMLTYVASQCKWKEHARALKGGGELLTLVAILMAHLGLHGQCIYN
ncbi:uncharacterized protein [Populus alba]|nr:uncharacterized protein LOC118046160 [Populus alba]